MTIRLVDNGWGEELIEALRADASELRIICPFIKVGPIGRLLSQQPTNVQVITRFNLANFADRVSDVTALQRLLDAGATVRGVRNLHAKLYLFGKSRAIITSSNLTEAGLGQNHELGIVTNDAEIIDRCLEYFDSLWRLADNNLAIERVEAWDKTVTDYWLAGGHPNETASLKDYGTDVGVADPPPTRLPPAVVDAPQFFVKFLGGGDNRQPLSVSTIEEIEKGGCHWAACYPANRRPRSVEDGAIIFMGRFTRDPNDIRVFGRAVGMAYKDNRDDATPADIELRPWREKWSRYIRVHDAEFVRGSLANGVSLNELMDSLEADSFVSTQRHVARGEGNTNPRHAYRQQAAVELTSEGFSWLADRLQAAFEAHGKVPQDSLISLDWPDPSTITSASN